MAGAVAGFVRASATALALAASGAEAPAVFAVAATGSAATERTAERGVVGWRLLQQAPRLRTARIDFETLSAARRAAAHGTSAAVRLNLFEDAGFDWAVERTTRTERGYALSGPLAGVEAGTATLVVNGDVVVGSAWTPEGAYRIRTVGRTQIVERVDPSRGAACEGAAEIGPLRSGAAGRASARSASDAEESAAQDDGSEIDALVVYTPKARRRIGGHRAMLAEIDHDMAWTNEALGVSDAAHRVRLVAAVEVDYEEQTLSGDLGPLARPGDGRMDEVHALRDRHAADVVMLKRTSGGAAYMLTRLDASISSPWAFAIAGGIGDPATFPHALGHLMGVDHARGDEGSNGNLPFPYSHGYVLPDVRSSEGWKYRTIMQASGGNLPRFSTPRQRFHGVPLGVPGDEPTARLDGPADAVRSMDETRRLVANYRRSATRCRYRLSPPAAPEVPAAGGTYSLRVEADAGCAWTARAADGFTTVASGSSGVGDGTVEYRVPANGGWPREAALAVAGRMLVSAQPGTRPVKPACERSAVVREALEAELGAECADIAAADLAGIAKLKLLYASPEPGDFDGLANLGELALLLQTGATLKVGTFDGMASVVNLRLVGAAVSLEADAFRGLENLHVLLVSLHPRSYPADASEPLPPLPPGVFRGMPRLRSLSYWGGRRAVAPGLFEGLTGLVDLFVGGALKHLPAGALRGISNLRLLEVRPDAPLTLEPGVFDGLPNLERLELFSLAGVPRGTFEGLSGLRSLWLFNNAFASLEPGVFNGLSSLVYLRIDNDYYIHNVHRHELSTLPRGLFAGMPRLRSLRLFDAGLTELDPRAFDDVPRLYQLVIAGNPLAELPPGAFDSLPDLLHLYLRDNRLAALPPAVFQHLRRLRLLQLHGNRLTALPPGLFVGAGRDRPAAIGTLTLHGNPGAPFALALEPVVASAAWERPVRVAVRIAQGAPFALDVGLQADGGGLEEGPATTVRGARLSTALAVRPTGRAPVVVRVAEIPEVPGGAECAALVDAGKSCGGWPAYTGIQLAAGPPLVLNAIPDRRLAVGDSTRIGLAHVFLEFDEEPVLAVRSSDPEAVSATIEDGALTVAALKAANATVTVTATTADGRTATRTFAVGAEVVPRGFLRGWRLGLLEGVGGDG